MDPMMIGIAAVVIVVILLGVFLVMKKRQSSDNTTPTANLNRPKTLAEQQQELQAQRQQQPTTPAVMATPVEEPASTTDLELTTAQDFIEKQDYGSAAQTLKQAIRQNPKRADLQLMLLNTFALAKDYASFNAFYPNVAKLADPVVSLQAKNLKNLLDEEQSFIEQIQHQEEVIVDDDKPLEFDFLDQAEQSLTTTSPAPAVAQVANIPTPMPVADNDFSFDLGIDTPVTASKPTPAPVVAPTPVVEEELDFDFDMDMPAVSKAPNPSISPSVIPSTPAPTVVSTPAVEADLDFDFDIDTPAVSQAPAPAVVAPKPVAEEPLDFDFAMDTPSINEPMANPAPTTEVFAVSEPTVAIQPATTQPVETAQTVAIDDSFDDFDFDISTTEQPARVTAVADIPAVPANKADMVEDFDFDLSDNWDEPKADAPTMPTASQNPTPAPSVVNVESEPLLADDLVFDLDTDPVAPVAPQSTVAPQPMPSVEADNLFDFDANEVDLTVPTPTTASVPQAEMIAKDTAVDFSFDEDFALDMPSTTAEPLVEPALTIATTKENTPVADSIDFGSDLDLDFGTLETEPQATTLTAPVAPNFTVEPEVLGDNVEDTLSQLDALYAPSAEQPPSVTADTVTVAEPAPIVDSIEGVDEFDFDLDSSSDSVEAPVVETPAPTVEALTSESVTTNPASIEQPVATPAEITTDAVTTAMPVSNILGNTFDFIQELDVTQLNIDLAEQYIQLGEYDSAKRLLDEVSNTNDMALQSKINSLLEKIG
ncbi:MULTISPECIES: FimV/HubP family polar landmark protein [unclassified Moraxella]|uniref:FimV/HubP family polar landmark protein n=1 Tax=unclassified Moraxella TaxID=2685852 RepID=UPI003AF49136